MTATRCPGPITIAFPPRFCEDCGAEILVGRRCDDCAIEQAIADGVITRGPENVAVRTFRQQP